MGRAVGENLGKDTAVIAEVLKIMSSRQSDMAHEVLEALCSLRDVLLELQTVQEAISTIITCFLRCGTSD